MGKIICSYFEFKCDDFNNVVAHANDNHADNPISFGKTKLDSVNRFIRNTLQWFINPYPLKAVFCLGISCCYLRIVHVQKIYFNNYLCLKISLHHTVV